MRLPPYMAPGDKVVLFDGTCRMCDGWSQFLLRHDHERRLKLCSVQSMEGQAILAWFGVPNSFFDTMLFVDGCEAVDRSDAFFRVVAELPSPWRWMRWLRFSPLPLKDWLYDRITLNRQSLFGRLERCLMPTAEHRARFLGNS